LLACNSVCSFSALTPSLAVRILFTLKARLTRKEDVRSSQMLTKTGQLHLPSTRHAITGAAEALCGTHEGCPAPSAPSLDAPAAYTPAYLANSCILVVHDLTELALTHTITVKEQCSRLGLCVRVCVSVCVCVFRCVHAQVCEHARLQGHSAHSNQDEELGFCFNTVLKLLKSNMVLSDIKKGPKKTGLPCCFRGSS
jgi:hypothetical protein